jgi:GMP synthase (glutamine-hydrolysing)
MMMNLIEGVKWLAQGTIYPDVIESVSVKDRRLQKSHHNVGGLPDYMKLKL